MKAPDLSLHILNHQLLWNLPFDIYQRPSNVFDDSGLAVSVTFVKRIVYNRNIQKHCV